MFSCYCLALEACMRQNYQSIAVRVIGVTNMLEQAQVWQRQQQAKQAILNMLSSCLNKLPNAVGTVSD